MVEMGEEEGGATTRASGLEGVLSILIVNILISTPVNNLQTKTLL